MCNLGHCCLVVAGHTQLQTLQRTSVSAGQGNSSSFGNDQVAYWLLFDGCLMSTHSIYSDRIRVDEVISSNCPIIEVLHCTGKFLVKQGLGLIDGGKHL